MMAVYDADSLVVGLAGIPQRSCWQLSSMIRYRQALAILLTTAISLPAAAQFSSLASWPAFRGPTGDGRAAAGSRPPISWSENENVTWRTELPGSGWSSPVVRGDRIYLSAAIEEGSDFLLSLLIVDLKSGRLTDTINLMKQKPIKKIHNKNSHASPTAIVDGNRVYVHFGYQGTVCTDLDGNLQWQNRDFHFAPVHGNGGSPVLVDGRLIFTCDGAKNPKVVALDASTGQLAWERPRPVDASRKFSFATPSVFVIDGKQQVIVPGSDCVLSLAPDSGEQIWMVQYDGYSVVPKPIFHAGLVHVSTGFDQASWLAIDPSGSGDVTDTHVRWETDRNISKTPSMIGHDGLVYCVSDNGVAQCFDAKTGDLQYTKRLGGKFSSSPTIAGDKIYFTDEAGLTTVVRAGSEFEEIAENDLGERTLSSMAVVDNAILLRTADALYRIENK